MYVTLEALHKYTNRTTIKERSLKYKYQQFTSDINIKKF